MLFRWITTQLRAAPPLSIEALRIETDAVDIFLNGLFQARYADIWI